MPTPANLSRGVLLACVTCGNQQTFDLDVFQISDLQRHDQLRFYCAACGGLTSWSGVQADRRSGVERRTCRHTLIFLPIRVRCDLPTLRFTEVTHTLTASRKGASFTTHHSLSEGMTVYLVMPYGEADSVSFEKQARVVRVEKKQAGFEVGVEFLS